MPKSTPAEFLGVIFALVCIFETEGKFVSYWNSPLDTCNELGIHINLSQYGIIENDNGIFYGDKVNIFYDAGEFPSYDPHTGEMVNGGIPQLGNLTLHQEVFTARLHQLLKPGYTGPAPLDFERFKPSYDVDLPGIYKRSAIDWVLKQHPEMSKEQANEIAGDTFNRDIRPYFESLLRIAGSLRPGALVGYYHYPYCLNYQAPYTTCNPKMSKLNDEIQSWLYNASTALYPSVYSHMDITPEVRWDLLTTRLKEAQRVNRHRKVPVLAYFGYRYHSSPTLLSASVARAVLWMVKQFGGDGVMLWGREQFLKTATDCQTFKDYMASTLGPMLQCFHAMPDSFVRRLMERFPTEDTQQDASQFGTSDSKKRLLRHNQNLIVKMVELYCASINAI